MTNTLTSLAPEAPLLILFKFNPSMDNQLHPLLSVGWKYLSISKLQRCNNVWCRSAGANPFLANGSWPSGQDAGYSSGRRGMSLRFWGPRFNTGIHLMKQFAHNWYLYCCQCTETCSHVSFIQNSDIHAGIKTSGISAHRSHEVTNNREYNKTNFLIVPWEYFTNSIVVGCLSSVSRQRVSRLVTKN